MITFLNLISSKITILCLLHPASSIFLSHQTSTNQQPPTNQQHFSLTINQHQPQHSDLFVWKTIAKVCPVSLWWLETLRAYAKREVYSSCTVPYGSERAHQHIFATDGTKGSIKQKRPPSRSTALIQRYTTSWSFATTLSECFSLFLIEWRTGDGNLACSAAAAKASFLERSTPHQLSSSVPYSLGTWSFLMY